MAGTTPIYGFPYPESTDLVSAYPALGQTLAEDVETTISGLGSGLTLVSPSSIANSGGSASSTGGTTTFTGVSSVSLNGVFSGDYQNYKVVASLTGNATSTGFLRLRTSGSDITASNYYYERLYSSGGTSGGATASALSYFYDMFHTDTSGTNVTVVADIFSPQIASNTGFQSTGTGRRTRISLCGGGYDATTQADGLTVAIASGAITGTVRVYGYQGA